MAPKFKYTKPPAQINTMVTLVTSPAKQHDTANVQVPRDIIFEFSALFRQNRNLTTLNILPADSFAVKELVTYMEFANRYQRDEDPGIAMVTDPVEVKRAARLLDMNMRCLQLEPCMTEHMQSMTPAEMLKMWSRAIIARAFSVANYIQVDFAMWHIDGRSLEDKVDALSRAIEYGIVWARLPLERSVGAAELDLLELEYVYTALGDANFLSAAITARAGELRAKYGVPAAKDCAELSGVKFEFKMAIVRAL